MLLLSCIHMSEYGDFSKGDMELDTILSKYHLSDSDEICHASLDRQWPYLPNSNREQDTGILKCINKLQRYPRACKQGSKGVRDVIFVDFCQDGVKNYTEQVEINSNVINEWLTGIAQNTSLSSSIHCPFSFWWTQNSSHRTLIRKTIRIGEPTQHQLALHLLDDRRNSLTCEMTVATPLGKAARCSQDTLYYVLENTARSLISQPYRSA